MMRRAWVAVLLMACRADSVAPTGRTESTIAGTYALASVDGRPMPYSPADGVTYLQGRLILTRDSTFTEVQVIQFFQTTSTTERFGAFSLIGDSVRFTSPAYRAPFFMRLAHDTLMARWDDGLFVYRR